MDEENREVVDTDTEVEIGTGTETDVVNTGDDSSETETNAGADVADIENDSEAETDVDADVVDTEDDSETETDAETDADVVDTEDDSETETDAETDADVVDTEDDSETETDAETDADVVDTEDDSETETDAETDADVVDTEDDSETETDAETDADVVDTENDSETETDAETDADVVDTEDDSETETDAETDADVVDTEDDSETETDAETDADVVDIEDDSETETDAETDADVVDIEDDSEAETDADVVDIEDDSSDTSANSDDSDNGESSQITVGEFTIGFDASRINENNSGYFVADNVDTGAVLFDVSNPGSLSANNEELSISEADLLVSPEFAGVLGDESLEGADVGDTRIDATLESQDGSTFKVESGVTSVFLDFPLLESTAGLGLASVDSEAEAFSDEFQVGFFIDEEETDLTLDATEGFAPISGTIEHDGTVTFSTEVDSDDIEEDTDIEPAIDSDDIEEDTDIEPAVDSDDTEEDADIEPAVDSDDTEEDADTEVSIDPDDISGEDSSGDVSDFETIDLTDLADSTVEFTVSREAGFDNTVGFYEVNGSDGSVIDPTTGSTISPGEVGYQDAALANSLDFTLATGNGETSQFATELAGGKQYGTFIIADGGLDELLDGDGGNDPAIYFASAEANSSNFDHIRSAGSNTFEYEDLPNGMNDQFNDGTPDFNDMIVEYDFV